MSEYTIELLPLVPLPKVTREEFDAIDCSKCGQCCEVIWHPEPLQVAQAIGRNSDFMKSSPEIIREQIKFELWFGELEPTDTVNAWGQRAYHCPSWNKETKLCENYEWRPLACSEYPYNEPVLDHLECTFRVEIIDKEES